MANLPPPESISESLKRMAGYLNFSSGNMDPDMLAAWNHVYAVASHGDPLTGPAAWLVVKDWLTETIDQLCHEQSAFRDCHQAERVIRLLWSELLPAYLDFHRDLLFHQEPELLFNGFFLGRAADAILGTGLAHDDDQVVQAAIDQLDTFVGYRPVAMLERRECHPYRHEFVCPVPLYVQGAGVSAGPYHDILQLALDALHGTDPAILRAASFDPDRMRELSLDPRAYDFDHPVTRRPNYHFGGWDERSISADGYYDRFVVRRVMLDALLSRLNDEPDLCKDELLVEAATVLAGAMLMASAITGWGPGTYSSDVTLGSLMKPIAAFRDAYYEDRMTHIKGAHADRLIEEQQRRHQPFGGARQHLNAALAQRRADQLQRVQLARLYARMGYPDAAARQADMVSATSARMICRIDCVITQGLRALRAGDVASARQVPAEAFDLLQRGIQCGALIDPWDILGFGGQFSLFPGPESSVHDTRVDDMLYLIEQLFSFTARVWSEAAARDDREAYEDMAVQYRDMAEWWRQFAAHTVESIEASDPLESYESAKLVARALRLWHQGGAETGNVAFWAPHADLFDSPRAYALVISALLEREDYVASMALLVHWLSRADQVGLRLGGNSLPRLSERWVLRLRGSTQDVPQAEQGAVGDIGQLAKHDTRDVWPLVRKLFDYYEANAEQFWSAPQFLLGQGNSQSPSVGASQQDGGDDCVDDDDVESDGIFDAAYEGMTYRDTTDDGIDGAVFEFGDDSSVDELELESKRLVEHLNFMQSLARMWSVAADIAVSDTSYDDLDDRKDVLQSWADRARENRIGLLTLLDDVREYPISPAGSDKDSMRAYDRKRVVRDSLMERIIGTAVEMSDARRLVCGALVTLSQTHDVIDQQMPDDDVHAVSMFGALIGGDVDQVRRAFPAFLQALKGKNLLYIPLSRGGDPVKIYVARLRQRVLRHLIHWLPRRGLIAETCRLIDTAREMEQNHSVGMGAVTEFDSLFRAGFRSLVASVVESTIQATEVDQEKPDESKVAEVLIPRLETLTEVMLASWLAHSQTLRLSSLELVNDPKQWDRLERFIKAYGDPIFTQTFLQLGNVRAILHQGVADWLERAIDSGDEHLQDTRLFRDLQSGDLALREADHWISLVYEAMIDHHAEYLDYNSTTTQSDRGDLVYMFLDFLRLRVRYERIAWNLQPVMWAHEVLVRRGLEKSAQMWRRSLSERIDEESENFVQKLRRLQTNYAMRMPTVADRIMERFVQPMTVDRIRAQVAPAMRDAEAGLESHAFELLQQEADLLTRHPTGVGIDVPEWLQALEEEVEQLAKQSASSEIDPQSLMTIAISPLTLEELDAQLAEAQSQGRRLPHMN